LFRFAFSLFLFILYFLCSTGLFFPVGGVGGGEMRMAIFCEGRGGDVSAHSQFVWARCLLVGVPVVLGDGLGSVFACDSAYEGDSGGG